MQKVLDMKNYHGLNPSKIAFCAAVILSSYWVQTISFPLIQAQADPKSIPKGIRGELIYVPIYSSIFYENGKSTLDLAATLSIHNVNPDGKLILTRADYYDTKGKLIKKYVNQPVTLNTLETKNFVVDKSDTTGGTGANFLVEWHSDEIVVSPLVEAVMMNASSNLGIAFTTTGKVVRTAADAQN